MTANLDVAGQLCDQRLMTVVVIDNATHAIPLGDALAAAGLTCVEITLRTPAALESLRILTQRTDLCVGAGTVVRAHQVDEVLAAGAQFIVSPGISAEVVLASQEADVPVFPGVATATEIQMSLDLGVRDLKFFPAETLGGVRALAALSAPFPEVRFLPTGGIGPATLPDYLQHPAVLAVGGSWIATRASLAAKDFASIRRLAAEAIALTAPGTN
jgi:2-dehydro-3-deoxyphosphogluconate aldolase / (4S)-4-hydroxy-2-oxoglutarate aldolase